jgi:DNA invertase Pin-like site-specific DNA recombinase
VLAFLRPSDTVVVWRLDRLGRSLRQLIETVTSLHACGVGFKSLTAPIDTTTPSGKLIVHVFGALDLGERNLIRERTQAGLQASRARGRRGGQPRLLTSAMKVALVRTLDADKSTTVAEVCQTLHISRATLPRYLKTDQAQS